MSEYHCMLCGEPTEFDGRSYDCHECNTRWTPHNLSVSNEVEEIIQDRIDDRREYRERQERWNSLSRVEKLKVKLGLREVVEDDA